MIESIIQIVKNDVVIIFLLMLFTLFYKLEISKDKLSIKICILNLVIYLLGLLNVYDIKLMLLLYITTTFLYLQIFTIDSFRKKYIKNFFLVILDYIYKIVFEYGFIYLLISLFLVSTSFENIIKFYIHYLNINISSEYHNILYILLYITSGIFLIKSIICLQSEEFKTLKDIEILTKMNKILPFEEFELNTKLILFSNLLIYKEDKSYFIRENSYNWLGFNFIKYRIRRFLSYGTKYKACNIKYIGKIIHIFIIIYHFIYKILEIIYKIIRRICKFIKYKFHNIFKPNESKKYLNLIPRGYSTIEMQLIRTLAVTDGYTTHKYRRKVYELFYSTIFFTALKYYYGYYNFNNYYYKYRYKYYLIYIYIHVAPVNINGRNYKNILELYKKESIYDITNEEFFIWTMGLSHHRIDYYLLDYKIVKWAGLDKKILKKLIDKFNKTI